VATNRGYSSVPSDDQFLKPIAVPAGPAGVEVLQVAGSDNSLIVYLSAVNYPADGASKVTSYTVKYSTNTTFFNAMSDTVLLTETSFRGFDSLNRQIYAHTITNLIPGSAYYVQVAAVNKAGTGAYTIVPFLQVKHSILHFRYIDI
jgi:hypothetical protein